MQSACTGTPAPRRRSEPPSSGRSTIAAVPTTVGPDRPPKYPTTYYTDYMIEYQKRTYDLLADQQAAE